MVSITIDGITRRDFFYQWDKNQRLKFSGVPSNTEVHFSSLLDDSDALVMRCYEEDGNVYVDVPNILLQLSGDLFVYIYPYNGDEAHTSIKKKFNIRAREKPYDYVYTETELADYKKIAEQYEANVHYEQTLQDTKDILKPLVDDLQYMTYSNRSLLKRVGTDIEDGRGLYWDRDNQLIGVVLTVDEQALTYNYFSNNNRFDFVFLLSFASKRYSYGGPNINTVAFEPISRSIEPHETNQEPMFLSFISLPPTIKTRTVYFEENPGIEISDDRFYHIPVYIEFPTRFGSNRTFLNFYILDKDISNAIISDCLESSYNTAGLTIEVYKTVTKTITELSEALDIINGEVI